MTEKKLYDFVKELKAQGKSIDEVYEDVKRIKDIIQNALELKSKIYTTTDPVEKAELIYELGKLSKECKELIGMDLSMVI